MQSSKSLIYLKNISSVLSRNMIGVVCQFCNINTLFNLTKMNKKFKHVVEKLTILRDLLEEIKASISMNDARENFWAR